MAKFLFVYRGGDESAEPSPEEIQQIIQVWMDWIGKGNRGGVGWSTAVPVWCPTARWSTPDLSVTDGPFAEAKELVGGYSIVEASRSRGCGGDRQGLPDAGGRRHRRGASVHGLRHRVRATVAPTVIDDAGAASPPQGEAALVDHFFRHESGQPRGGC